MTGGMGALSDDAQKAVRKAERDADRQLHESKMKLLRGIERAVKEQSQRKNLSKRDPLYLHLKSCHPKEILRFAQKLRTRINELEGYTARIEASLARQALHDLEIGDYRSSRLKPYEDLFID